MALSATDQTVTAIPATGDRLRPVRIWLYCIALLVLAMVVVGGATRLTESGLSITTWQPVSGTIPPLSLDVPSPRNKRFETDRYFRRRRTTRKYFYPAF